MQNSASHAATTGRIEAIDLARGLALIAMASYHFTFDLGMFGFIPANTAVIGGWKLFAHVIASSFLFLVGIGFILSHNNQRFSQVNWRRYFKRLGQIAGCAAIISIATWINSPEEFVFFGILHEIALASIIALAFLRAPWWLCLIAGLFVHTAKIWLQTSALNSPIFWWSGLQEIIPSSVDYVPVFPWFAAVLYGMAAGKLMEKMGFFKWLSQFELNQPPARLLKLFGRHSLIFYMLHQPIMIACIIIYIKLTSL